MNVMDVVSKVQVFNSLLTCGMKLSLSLVVLVLMLRTACQTAADRTVCGWGDGGLCTLIQHSYKLALFCLRNVFMPQKQQLANRDL